MTKMMREDGRQRDNWGRHTETLKKFLSKIKPNEANPIQKKPKTYEALKAPTRRSERHSETEAGYTGFGEGDSD